MPLLIARNESPLWLVIKRRTTLLVLSVFLLINIRICSSDIESERSNFLTLINQYRQDNGMAPLKISNALTTASQLHSEDMAAHNYFSHNSLDGRTPVDRMKAAGYNYNTYYGENIAAGYSTAQAVFDAWKNSPTHNANMLNPNYVVIGVGLAYNASSTYKYYWTTDFGGYDDSGTSLNNPPNIPSTPSGPSVGYSGTSYSFSTSSTDPDGDQVKYTFDWGDGTSSTTNFLPSGSIGSLSHAWSSKGQYNVRAKATDTNGESSDWSSPFTITIENRPPNTPTMPLGPTKGFTFTSYIFTTSTTDSDGNQLKYTFDWGDGTTTTTSFMASGSIASASHSWSRTGNYSIKVMATDNDGGVSDWSQVAMIEIENSPPSTPASPLGETSCLPNSSYEYRIYAYDPDGDEVRCIFDWGDGTTMETEIKASGSSFIASHSWSRLGMFHVKVKAIDFAGRESQWSQPLTIFVKFSSSMMISISASTIARGERLTVNGSIDPPCSSTVTITYLKPDGSKVTNQVVSDQDGRFHDSIVPNLVGTWSVRASWNGDESHFGSSTMKISFQVDPALCSITFESNATGLSIVVDGVNYSMPKSFRWREGTVHTAILEQVHKFKDGGRYVFRKWSDGNYERSRSILVKESCIYRAIYSIQYFVSVKIEPNSSWSENWYELGSVIRLSINSTIIQKSKNKRLVFEGWSNNSSGTTIDITVDGPLTLEARWKKQFLLQIDSIYGYTEGGGWHDEGSNVHLLLYPFMIDCGNGTRRKFISWLGEGSGSYSGNELNVTLTVSGAMNESAQWRSQYLVIINSAHGHPIGEGWYDELEQANISIEPVVYYSNTTRFTFKGWNGSITGRDTNVTFVVSSPSNIEAIWQKEFYLNLSSSYGKTWGEGWYKEGSNASFGVLPPPTNIVRFVFDGWVGDVDVQTLNATVLMDGPKSVSAMWHRDYTYVTAIFVLGLLFSATIIYKRKRSARKKVRKFSSKIWALLIKFIRCSPRFLLNKIGERDRD